MVENSPTTPGSSGKPFSQFLIDTGHAPLVLVGKSIQQFGLAAVGSFLLGAASVFLYAFFTQSLPFVKQTSSVAAKPITLHGSVQTLQGKPLDAFEVAVIESRQGPFRNGDGTFTITVPHKDKYSVAVLAEGYFPMNVYGDLELIKEGEIYKLPPLRAFPANLGLVEGTVRDAENRPVNGFVKVQEKLTKIGSDGSFQLPNIPLGHLKLSILKDPQTTLPIHEEYIDVNLMSPTPHDVTVLAHQ